MSRACLFVAAATAALLSAPSSHALPEPVESGSFTMESDPGDYVGAGESYSFEPAELELGVGSDGLVILRTAGYKGTWYVELAAPDREPLEEREYVDARDGDDPTQAYLQVSGGGRRCGEVVGSFTVHDIEYGPHDYVQSLRASFEQRCEGATAALRGELEVVAPPAPEALELDVSFDTESAAIDPITGWLVLRGEVTCTQQVTASIYAEATETGREEGAAIGGGGASAECSPTPTEWEAKARSSNAIAFTDGPIEVELYAKARDDAYSEYHDSSREATAELASEAVVGQGGSESLGFVARNADALVVGWLAVLAAAVLGTALATVLIARRRYGRRSGGTPEPS